MNVYYKILSVNEKEHSINVRYFTDNLTEEQLADSKDIYGETVLNQYGHPEKCRTDFNITFYNDPNPSVESIKESIKSVAPIQWFKMQEEIIANTEYSLSNANSMINMVNSFDTNLLVSNNQNVIQGLYTEVYNLIENSDVIYQKIKNYVDEKFSK